MSTRTPGLDPEPLDPYRGRRRVAGLRVQHVPPDPDRVWPWNEAFDVARVDRIADSMRGDGWVGRPLVLVSSGDGRYRALTGSHRLAAALDAGLPTVPVVVVALPAGWRSRRDGLHRGRRLLVSIQEAVDLLEQDGMSSAVVRLIRED